MVTQIHSACKLCYCVHTNDHNPGPMFSLTMPWNTTYGWWFKFTQHVSCAIVYTPMIIIRDPCSFWLCFEHNLWMVTWIHSDCKLCYCVHTNDHNLRPMIFLNMLWNTTCGLWLGFTQQVSCAIVSNDHNLRPVFFLTIPWNTTCGWRLGFT